MEQCSRDKRMEETEYFQYSCEFVFKENSPLSIFSNDSIIAVAIFYYK